MVSQLTNHQSKNQLDVHTDLAQYCLLSADVTGQLMKACAVTDGVLLIQENASDNLILAS